MQQNPLKLFCFKRISGVAWIPIFEINFGAQKRGTLFQSINPTLYEGIWTLVDTLEEADYCIFPHGYSSIRKNKDYISSCVDIATQHNKHIILFAYQDSHEEINIPRTIVFRSSQYKSLFKKNEIIMPAFVEDLGVLHGVMLKEKSEKPSVGFVGKASFENTIHMVRYSIKNFFKKHPYKDGLFYRRKIMKLLSKDDRIDTHFIARSSYSGNIKSIPLDPVVARNQYVENMMQNDMALIVKGDGNYSLRFYEALSLGRIPLFLDTGCVLPFEEKIGYDDVIVRIPYTDIRKSSSVAYDNFMSWSTEEYKRRQKKAREIFIHFLYMPTFIKNTFAKDFLVSYEMVFDKGNDALQ